MVVCDFCRVKLGESETIKLCKLDAKGIEKSGSGNNAQAELCKRCAEILWTNLCNSWARASQNSPPEEFTQSSLQSAIQGKSPGYPYGIFAPGTVAETVMEEEPKPV